MNGPSIGDRTLDALPPGARRAHPRQGRGARGRTAQAEQAFRAAAAEFREFGMPFWRAVTQLDHAEWLAGGMAADGDPAALVADCRQAFEGLGAVPWLQRLERVEPSRADLTEAT